MSASKTVEEPKEPAPTAPAVAPATEKPTTKPAEAAAPNSDHVGKRIAKKFGKKNFYGEITEKWTDEKDSSPNWHVKYDDGDEEDFNQKELDTALKQYEKAKRYDFKIFPRKPSTPKKRKPPAPPPSRTNKYPKRGTSKKD